jgi:hypothetical protein
MFHRQKIQLFKRFCPPPAEPAFNSNNTAWGAQLLDLSSRPKRSVAEGPAVRLHVKQRPTVELACIVVAVESRTKLSRKLTWTAPSFTNSLRQAQGRPSGAQSFLLIRRFWREQESNSQDDKRKGGCPLSFADRKSGLKHASYRLGSRPPWLAVNPIRNSWFRSGFRTG